MAEVRSASIVLMPRIAAASRAGWGSLGRIATFAPASSMKKLNSSVVYAGLSGAAIAPARATARNVATNSYPFMRTMETGVPGPTPLAAKMSARRSTSASSSSYVHDPMSGAMTAISDPDAGCRREFRVLVSDTVGSDWFARWLRALCGS